MAALQRQDEDQVPSRSAGIGHIGQEGFNMQGAIHLHIGMGRLESHHARIMPKPGARSTVELVHVALDDVR